jgi:hypothetical protein
VSQLLRQHGYRRRKAQKKKTMGHHRDRNAQFEKIARLRKKYLKAGLPVISIDTKKKELLGDFYREGRIDAQATIETNDHDFSSTGSGVVIPHGVYDVGRNRGFLHLNTSHDTSELACDSIAAWWDEHGRSEYPGAKWSISQLTVGLGTMVFVRPKVSTDPGRPEHLSLGVQSLQECLQSGAIEFPGKRAGLTIAELLVQQQSLLYLL